MHSYNASLIDHSSTNTSYTCESGELSMPVEHSGALSVASSAFDGVVHGGVKVLHEGILLLGSKGRQDAVDVGIRGG